MSSSFTVNSSFISHKHCLPQYFYQFCSTHVDALFKKIKHFVLLKIFEISCICIIYQVSIERSCQIVWRNIVYDHQCRRRQTCKNVYQTNLLNVEIYLLEYNMHEYKLEIGNRRTPRTTSVYLVIEIFRLTNFST